MLLPAVAAAMEGIMIIDSACWMPNSAGACAPAEVIGPATGEARAPAEVIGPGSEPAPALTTAATGDANPVPLITAAVAGTGTAVACAGMTGAAAAPGAGAA